MYHKIEKEFFAIQKKGNLHFKNNEFDKAIIEYEKLNIMDLNSIKELELKKVNKFFMIIIIYNDY